MCRWSRGIWGSARIVGPGPDRCWCRQEHFATFPGANTTTCRWVRSIYSTIDQLTCVR